MSSRPSPCRDTNDTTNKKNTTDDDTTTTNNDNNNTVDNDDDDDDDVGVETIIENEVGAGVPANEGITTRGGDGALSKRAMKRALRRMNMLATKKDRKAAAKERRKKRKMEEKHMRDNEEEEGGVEQPKQEDGRAAENADNEDGNIAITSTKLSKKALRYKRRRELESARPKVVLDLDWYSEMTERETRSCFAQIAQSYGANARAAYPVQLWLTGLGSKNADDERRARAAKSEQATSGSHDGHELTAHEDACCWSAIHSQHRQLDSWAIKISRQSFPECLAEERAKMVYLTADSDVILDTIDEDCVYIIGALVDRNRLKHATIKKAKALGLQTARFPLKENKDIWSGGTPHLTINATLALLHARRSCASWAEAFASVLPPRKLVDDPPKTPKSRVANTPKDETAAQPQPQSID